MKKLIFSTGLICLFHTGLRAQTACNDFVVNTAVTASTCMSNGTITVTLTGADASKLTDIQYSLESVPAGQFSLMPSSDNVLAGIPSGTYTVTVSAFCNTPERPSVTKIKTNVVVGGNYQIPELSFVAAGRTSNTTVPASRNSYAGCTTGQIVMLLKGGNQTTQTTSLSFTITSAPVGVTVPQTVTATKYTSGSLTAGYRYTLPGLYPAGNYTVTIDDGCYTASKDFTLAELTTLPNANGPTSTTMSYDDVYPYLGNNDGCALINLNVATPTYNADFYQYYRDGLYEIGAAPLGGTPTHWTTWESNTPLINLSPNKISDFYNSPSKMSVYFRVKNCPATQRKYDIYIYKPNTWYGQTYIYYCDKIRTRLYFPSTYSNVFCYPAIYKVVNNTTQAVIATQEITDPYQIDSLTLAYNNTSYTVTVTDKDGTVMSRTFTPPEPINSSPTSDRINCNTWENYYTGVSNNLRCFPVNVDIKDAGGTTVATDIIASSADSYSPPLEYGKTYTFKFTYPNIIVNGSAHTHQYSKSKANSLPTSLTLSIHDYVYHEECAINNGSLRIYTGPSTLWPVGTKFTITGPAGFETYTLTATSSTYAHYIYNVPIPPGSYTITADFGCSTVTSTTTLPGIYDVKDFTYTTQKTCEGMKLTPSAKLTHKGIAKSAYFRLTNGPGGTSGSYDKSAIGAGESFILSAPGTYTLAVIVEDNATKCALATQTIVYEQLPMRLDNSKTAAYACVGSSVGNIALQAVNGVAPYTYELWNEDNTVKLQDAKTSSGRVLYTYGTPGETYTVRITDACGNSMPQKVSVADLETAKLVFAEANPVCYGGEIRIRCLTLGETTYTWTGPDGATYTGQEIVIPNADATKAGEYTVSVKPEFCGTPVQDKITIQVRLPLNITSPELSNQTLRICPQEGLTLGETVTGGSGTYTYKWEYSSNGTTWTPVSNTASTYTVRGPVRTTDAFVYKYVRRTVTDTSCGSFIQNYTLNVSPCYFPVNPDLMNMGTGNPLAK